MSLSPEEITKLLTRSLPATTKYPRPVQVGPLRHFDTVMRCASRGCGSSTYCKVSGIPRCMTHALQELNQMLVDLGVARESGLMTTPAEGEQ